jgi:predicted MFS family arabinose efflux permease
VVAVPAKPASVVLPRPRLFAATEVEHYTPLWLAGALWSIARWGTSVLGAYLANRMSGSPRLVQLTGVALWAPLLVGGVIGGTLSDRIDRRRTLLAQFWVLIPAAALMGLLAHTDRLRLWMIYPFMVLVGVGWVIDMTSRRALVFDLVGRTHIDNAMALESLSTSAGLAMGTLFGGTAVAKLGIGSAYLCVAGLLVASFALLLAIPKAALTPAPGAAASAPPAKAALRDGLRLLRTHRALVSVLGVTAFVNFFYFSFSPLVQIIGKSLGRGPTGIGVLASMSGFGMMIGSMAIARSRPRRRGMAYVAGAYIALGLLIPFAVSDWFAVSIVMLLLSSIGTGLFGSTQSTLVMTAVPVEIRGRALGLLSTAIGTLPLGMILLGEVAEQVGAPAALVASASVGLACMVVWHFLRPEVRKLET